MGRSKNVISDEAWRLPGGGAKKAPARPLRATPPLSGDNIRRTIDPAQERLYAISVGASRRSRKWTTERLTWAELRDRFTEPKRTKESRKEYEAMSADDRVEAKDVGGFVGGELKDGERKKSNLLYRSVLTIDIDRADAPAESYALVREQLPVTSFVLHSTHSHTAERPRLRLILPLSRDVSGEEYSHLVRRITELIDPPTEERERVDPGSDQGERLMFWPSCSSDGVYYVESFDGIPLTVDKWLGGTDPETLRRGAALRAEDPRAKRGIVGWFCRAYTIQQAIEELLPGVYEPAGAPNRWTYAEGHTTGGAIVYDEGRYIYSYHATDPAEGQLLNAFDLVRIHRFGSYDLSVTERTPMGKRPSWEMMCDFAGSLERVQAERQREMLEQVTDGSWELSEEPPASEAEGEPTSSAEEPVGEEYDPMSDKEEFARWANHLVYRVDKAGKYTFDNSHTNVLLILEHDRRLKGAFRKDLFHDRAVVARDLPWRTMRRGVPDYLTDEDVGQLRSWLSSHYYKIDNRNIIDDALVTVENRHAFHPVRDYLLGLTWDGRPRVERLLVETMAAPDTVLTHEMTLRWMKAAVARVLEERPVKFDNMLVLAGETGCGKSTLLERLGKSWYSPTMVSPDNIRQASAQLQGSWIIEDAELIGVMSSGVANAKGFLSKTTDDFIAPYGRHKTYRRRECVFAGTTNESDFLRDATGERRYWTIEVRQASDPAKHPYRYLTPAVVDQLWAEAVARYREDPSLILSKECEEELRRVQRSHKEVDVWADAVRSFLDCPAPKGYRQLSAETLDAYYYNQQGVAEIDSDALEVRTVVSFSDICRWGLGFRSEGRIPRDARKRINHIMAGFEDWEPCFFKVKGNAQRGWKKSQYGTS